MMYQSAGLQSETPGFPSKTPKPKAFLGSFAEKIIADTKNSRILPPGDAPFKGLEGSGGFTINDREQYYT